MGSLQGANVLITGARSGIGLATAHAAHEAGAIVWGLGRRLPDDPTPFQRFDTVDVTDDEQVSAYFASVESVPLHGLVNSAGGADPASFLGATMEELDAAYALNLRGPFLVSQFAARKMVAVGSGSIVHVSSVNATRGVSGTTTYSVTKGGLSALTRSMAVELARHGVRVNDVAPAATDTERLRRILNERSLADRVARIPLGRLGDAKEIADAIIFLLSDEATFITGQSLGVDGGYLALGS